MAYRVRFYMDMNAREAMHVIELRTSPQGHPSYRRICQRMHDLIRDGAGHRAIADAMRFADHSEVELERLQSERALEKKHAAQAKAREHTPTSAQEGAATVATKARENKLVLLGAGALLFAFWLGRRSGREV